MQGRRRRRPRLAKCRASGASRAKPRRRRARLEAAQGTPPRLRGLQKRGLQLALPQPWRRQRRPQSRLLQLPQRMRTPHRWSLSTSRPRSRRLRQSLRLSRPMRAAPRGRALLPGMCPSRPRSFLPLQRSRCSTWVQRRFPVAAMPSRKRRRAQKQRHSPLLHQSREAPKLRPQLRRKRPRSRLSPHLRWLWPRQLSRRMRSQHKRPPLLLWSQAPRRHRT